MKNFKFDRKAPVTFVVFFLAAVIVFTGVRIGVSALSEKTVFNPDDGKILADDMKKVEVEITSPFYDAFKDENRVNILLLGVADKNTDTIMVASYHKTQQTVSIISVPRDTYYAREGYSNYAYNKINSVYRTEDVTGIATAVSETLYGMPIHYYALVEYEDIRKVMDAIGGVYVDVPFRMKYDDPTADPPLHIDIPQGHVLIDSSNVEQYLRFRHGNTGYKSYSNGDIGRIQVQQEFVKIVIKECLKLGNVTEVAKVALQNINSDITYTAAISLAKSAMNGLSAENISTYKIPGTGEMLHGLSFWMPDDKQIYTMLEEILLPSTTDNTVSESASSGAVANK